MISFYIFLFSFGCVFVYDLYTSPPKIQEVKPINYSDNIFAFTLTSINSIIQSICIDYISINKLQSEYTLYNTFLSIPLYFIITDAYFYITHRILHVPILYKYFHKIHHNYKSPTIYASYYEHPVEHIFVWSMPYIILPHIIPIHKYGYWLFIFYTSLLSVLGHCGNNYKFNVWYNLNFIKSKNNYYYFTHPYHHDLHHLKLNCNYSLYFTYLDRIFNTLYYNYEVYVNQKLNE